MADFLLRLAPVYSVPPAGSEELGEAIRTLSRQVRRGFGRPSTKPQAIAKPERARPISSGELATLSAEAVLAFIDDELRSKADLLELGQVRFSMAKSALKKERIEGVRRAIRGALMHESSLEIIGEEAAKGGNSRRFGS